ncbi:PREDICTED: putative methylesterase 12, chloroplastic [Tarenaya hassleriana]|uniref:putative methylesterase 12, chloroplastic n=1 Tax=Tarenaya hassleriana TaxID=28532 RepID=UPI00053CA938|nr:PREDICTED: putative methylesterase 12, chloroplastic [Tarenaya hassleriana]
MGNNFICMKKKDSGGGDGSRSKRLNRSQRKLLAEEDMLHRRALSMAIHQAQLSQRFDGSVSRRVGSTGSRRRNLSNPFSGGKQKQVEEFLESLKVKNFILVHGERFGAWCWYKTIASLEESGLSVTALDLAGSGFNLKDTNSVLTVEEYSTPLTEHLENLPEGEKVILVGHSTGGACISYALERFPEKISKAIFICGTMVSDDQRPFDPFAEELGSAERFMKESQFLIYGNGEDNPPTGFMFEKQHMKGLYFNQSPAKDIALAMVSMRPVPLGPMMEKLSLTAERYGKGRRFYVQTLDDRALSPDAQETAVRENPPEGVFKIKGSDHSPFFSKPLSLHKILLDIAQIP